MYVSIYVYIYIYMCSFIILNMVWFKKQMTLLFNYDEKRAMEKAVRVCFLLLGFIGVDMDCTLGLPTLRSV